MTDPTSLLLYDPEELAAQRKSLKWRALIACLAGLFAIGICLDLGIQRLESSLSFQQESTVRRIKNTCTSLETYHSEHHEYPPSLRQLTNWNAPVRDAWDVPLIYRVRGTSYILMSYGADKKVGGEEFGYDLSNVNLSLPQVHSSPLAVLAYPASGLLKLGCLVCGCLMAVLTFGSVKAKDLTGTGLIVLLLKIGLIGVAAFCTSIVVLIGDMPLGH